MSATPEQIALDEHLRHLAECRDPEWMGETATNALAELKRLRSQLAEAQRTVAFFASVIKSGEPWTSDCAAAFDRAARSTPERGDPEGT